MHVGSAHHRRALDRHAVAKLAQAERLRAEAGARLVEFDAIDGHVAEGYLTPQRQLIDGAGVADAEANRILRSVRFCQNHPMLAEQPAAGLITVAHADETNHWPEPSPLGPPPRPEGQLALPFAGWPVSTE